MNKINDKLHYGKMDASRRQRVVSVGGNGAMTQDRVRCPFCSELILRDAIKCRFCGEWFSIPEGYVGAGRPADDNAPAVDDEGRDRPSPVRIQHRLVPEASVQHSDTSVQDAGKGRDGEQIGHVEQSPVRVAREIIAGDGLDVGLIRRRRGIPKVRILLAISYLAIVAVMVVMESRAGEMLREAGAKEKAQDPNEAFAIYSNVRDRFPFSFAIIEARQGLLRICRSQEREMPRSSLILRIEDFLGKDVGLADGYLMPFVAWPVGALLLFLVLLTRVFRPGIALLALLLTIVAVGGSVAQFAYYGLVPWAPVAETTQEFMQAPVAVYSASYLLLGTAALMTLTATAKRRDLEVAKLVSARRENVKLRAARGFRS